MCLNYVIWVKHQLEIELSDIDQRKITATTSLDVFLHGALRLQNMASTNITK